MNDLTDGYTIRLARLSDFDAIQAVDLAASTLFDATDLIDEGPDGPTPIPLDALKAGFRAGLLFVATDPSDAPVGFVLNRKISPDLYLEQISVDPAHGRRGLGRALVNRSVTLADDLRLRGVLLSTFRDLAWNGPFYASLGFHEVPRKRMKPWMLALEHIQAETMDVSLRCFMRRPGTWNRHWIRLTAGSKPTPSAKADRSPL